MTPPTGHDSKSYTQIIKSTMLIGGASVVNVMFSILRNKAMALLLGPEGIGVMALYNSIVDISQTVAGLGINASGVRQIAAVNGEDTTRVSEVVTVLRGVSLLLGAAGAVLLLLFSGRVAQFTFGDSRHTLGVMVLSLGIFFQVAAGGRAALIQGMRDISSLAWMSVVAGLFSLVVGVPIIYLLGEPGIAISLAAAAFASFVASWWFSRRIKLPRVRLSPRRALQETSTLFKLGVVFMASGFLTMGSAYAIRLIVSSESGLHAAGLYQAAWSLGGLYAGFILQAMGTDFYPRLTAVCEDHAECNRLVNEQTEVSILLAGPGLIATLTLAPAVMALFYSSEFQGAVDILRWICLGMMLRIVAWPIGFIVLAKGAKAIFFWSEVAATVVHVGLAWLCVPILGAAGAGLAFFGLYVWHSVLIYCVARRFTNFRWSLANRRLIAAYLLLSALVFGAFQLLPLWQATGLGLAIAILVGLLSLRTLAGLLPQHAFPRIIRPLLNMRGI
ncbi:PST family polysaccharide transporter [Rhizobium tibeticum]|uniref:O-antigen translocase n=1 Tax=Rhizobium tibeticum TaxID=501024 RepID=UPI00277DB1E5|nr:O-antigen translocase [Rhizobium tibeticum]MDP9811460.1 PST family polysaccharide transporter [Rhizobium tibeticum]